MLSRALTHCLIKILSEGFLLENSVFSFRSNLRCDLALWVLGPHRGCESRWFIVFFLLFNSLSIYLQMSFHHEPRRANPVCPRVTRMNGGVERVELRMGVNSDSRRQAPRAHHSLKQQGHTVCSGSRGSISKRARDHIRVLILQCMFQCVELQWV